MPSKHKALSQCCFNVGPTSKTVGQHQNNIGLMPRVCWVLSSSDRIHVSQGIINPGIVVLNSHHNISPHQRRRSQYWIKRCYQNQMMISSATEEAGDERHFQKLRHNRNIAFFAKPDSFCFCLVFWVEVYLECGSCGDLDSHDDPAGDCLVWTAPCLLPIFVADRSQSCWMIAWLSPRLQQSASCDCTRRWLDVGTTSGTSGQYDSISSVNKIIMSRYCIQHQQIKCQNMNLKCVNITI